MAVFETSETIVELAKALAQFQGEVKDPRKSEENAFLKSKYVSLDGLINAVRPVLSKYGISFAQFPQYGSEWVRVTTVLFHSSGEYIADSGLSLKVEKNTPQGVGSAITYARRYSLGAILGIGWDNDDDGESGRARAELWQLILSEGAKNGKLEAGIKEHIKKTTEAKSLSELTILELNKVLEWAKQ